LKLLPLEFKPSIIFGYYAGNIRLFNVRIHCLVEQQVLRTHADGRYWSLQYMYCVVE